ncbi:MAG TPA: polysaccharide biosynthesis tyrosine autokinase [Rudaea sp.]|jgi:capsular exopolysaccharide synthesis family protein|uniref:GumC family protein n=1 Tax=Rudaea sp. TaxID=2136325 RepID=UPI002F92A8B2
MRDDKFPVPPGGGEDQFPIRQDPQGAGRKVAVLNPGQSISPQISDSQRGAEQNEIDLLAYWQLLVKRRWLILGIISTVVALALIQTLLTTPIYRATAVIQIEKDSIQVMDVHGVSQTDIDYDPSYNQTQFGLLRSRSLAERVAEDLNLTDSGVGQRLAAPTWWRRLFGLLGFGSHATNQPQSPGKDLDSAPGAKAGKLRAAAGIVQGGLSIDPVRNSHLVQINFDSVIPAFSAQVANAVADGFIASTMDRQFGASSYAKKYLEEQLTQLKSRLEDSERALVEFAQKENIVPTKDGTSLVAENLSDLNASMAKSQDQRIRAEARWNAAKSTSGMALPADMLSGNPVLLTLQQQHAQLQAQYQNNLQTYKPDYPSMLALKGQIDNVQKQIAGEFANVRSSVKAEYDAAVAQQKMLEAQIDKLRVQTLDVDSRSIQYNILKRDADTNRQLYNALLQRYKEIGIAGGVKSSNISIVDRAEVPGGRYAPSLSRNLGVGLLLGSMLGILMALLLEYLDDTLRTPLDIEKHLHLPVLGIIPKLNKESTEEVQKDPRSAFSESYRSVRTALQFSTDRGTPKVLLITSPAPGEGKSTAALTLARGLSQLGKRVLLIEGDMRRPSLGKTLRVSADVGLSNLLAGGSTMAQTVMKTENPRLDLILSGPVPPNPTELLAGPKMISLLLTAGEKYDQIIIDGPPVLGIADAPVLANIATGTLLVTKAGGTRISSAKSSIKRLWGAHARLIGAMINQHNYKTVAYGYNYYGYSYGDTLKLNKK